MASGSATDVPPNFITMGPAVAINRPEQAFGLHQLGIEHGRAGGAANRVVTERDELDVEHRAGPEAADGDGHAAVALDVEPRLRPVVRVQVDDRGRRRDRQPELLRPAAEAAQRRHGRRRSTALASSAIEILSVWPSMTGTRVVCALTITGWGVTRVALRARRESSASRSPSSLLRRR